MYNTKQQPVLVEDAVGSVGIRTVHDLWHAMEVQDEFILSQNTHDLEQLKPLARMQSIAKVWEAVVKEFGAIETAIDIGSGFGYGAVFLALQGIKVLGIENIAAKIRQAQALFKRLGVNISLCDGFGFSNSPALMHADILTVQTTVKVDLLSMFYVSAELIAHPKLLEQSVKLLKPGGRICISTEADVETVRHIINSLPYDITQYFELKYMALPGNFEQSVLLLKLR